MDVLDAIREAVALHRGWLEEARQKGDASATVKRWTRRMEALQEGAEELARLRALVGPVEDEAGDLSDLPPALLAELSGRKPDLLEERILSIVRAAGEDGVGLDRLLIELWRRFREVQTRKSLNNKTYRMVARRLIEQVPDRRGTYRAAAEPGAGSSQA